MEVPAVLDGLDVVTESAAGDGEALAAVVVYDLRGDTGRTCAGAARAAGPADTMAAAAVRADAPII
jgi:hypothetical protein